MEVKRAKNKVQELDDALTTKIKSYEYMVSLWGEFEHNLVTIEDVELGKVKIAGVKIPILKEVLFKVKDYSVFSRPFWYTEGVKILQDMASIGIERDFYFEKMRLLDYARKKTTQKVNLYEKVQIPGYENAIRKIKRFLEDEENLSKSAMKIVKKRYENVEVES